MWTSGLTLHRQCTLPLSYNRRTLHTYLCLHAIHRPEVRVKTTRFSVIYIHKKRGGCSSNNNRDIGSQRWSWVCIEKKRVTGSLLLYVCVCVCVCVCLTWSWSMTLMGAESMDTTDPVSADPQTVPWTA